MSELAEEDQYWRSKGVQEDQASAREVDSPGAHSPPSPRHFAIPHQSELGDDKTERQSKQAYTAGLRRSIQQMANGDVQPVREGLEELRRELAADAQEHSLDR